MAFKNLRNKNQFAALKEKMDKEGKANYDDDRYWSPEVDKNGNGFAVIRFLPEVDGEDLPYVKLYSHGFKSGTKWFIENCRTSIGEACPVCEANNALWETGTEENKTIVRNRKRQLRYISNILVLSDTKHPENEGQVFLFKYGAKIFEKIKSALSAEFEDEKAFNPFDFWEGANFKLKIRNFENFRNYDKSEFEKPSALFDGDEALLEALWKKQYSLNEVLDPSKFKSYEDIKTRFEKTVNTYNTPRLGADEYQEEEYESRKEDTSIKSKMKSCAPAPKEDDDNLDFYSKLLEDDIL